MTDRELLIELLSSFGFEYVQDESLFNDIRKLYTVKNDMVILNNTAYMMFAFDNKEKFKRIY